MSFLLTNFQRVVIDGITNGVFISDTFNILMDISSKFSGELFFWCALSISKVIGIFNNNKIIDITRIIDESFANKGFLPIMMLVR